MAVTAQELFEAVYDVAPDRDPVRAMRLGTDNWSAMKSRDANDFDAETCRLLFLSAASAGEPDPATVKLWRTRALARFALLGWHEGVAATITSEAFAALAADNEFYRRGRTLDRVAGSERALLLLAEVAPFASLPASGHAAGDRSPDRALISRFVAEKGGFLLLLLGRFDEAAASYEQALIIAAGSPRGECKVRAGALLVE